VASLLVLVPEVVKSELINNQRLHGSLVDVNIVLGISSENPHHQLSGLRDDRVLVFSVYNGAKGKYPIITSYDIIEFFT
jgi:hypothetical protein